MRSLIGAGVLIGLAGIGALVPRAPGYAPPADAREAVERSLAYLEREGFAWMDGRVPIQDGRGCVSCHQVGYAVWSLRAAQRLGIERPGTRVELLERRATSFLEPNECRAASCGPLLLARDGDGVDAGAAALARQLLEIREREGNWRARGQFPTQRRPIAETDAVTTMWTMLALDASGVPDADSEASGRWLRAAEPGESTEWLLARLLVEHRAGNAGAAGSFARRLLERQNEDGGWPWKAAQASDAMTTGQAVYALAIAGDSGATRAALERGVAYLLATQRPGGTWVTPSDLVSTEPGPGKDYVYTFWGTAWAAIGLARTLHLPAASR